MTERLTGTTVRGFVWSFADRFSQQAVGFVISVILARLLLPAEFGLMAMLTIFIAVSQVLISGGFGDALVQKKDASHLDECSVFFVNIAASAVATGALYFAAPLIADFYGMPLLTPMTRVLALTLLINAFGLIQVSLMIKRVDFKKQMKVSLASTVAAGAVGVTMAVSGFGVWSLVWQAVLGNLLKVLLLWRVHGWRPGWKFSMASLRGLFAFGSKMLSISLIDTVFKNLYLMVIGKVFSPADLGFFARAQSIQQLPVQNIAVSSDLVSFPVFASIQDDKARMKRGMRQGVMLQAVVNFPIMVGLACVAEPFVKVLLTGKWLPCVPYLQLLCLAGLFTPVSVINISALKAQGRADLFLRLEVIKKAMILIAVAVTYRWGIAAMILGQVASGWTGYYLNAYYTAKFIGYPIREQLADILPSFGVASLMGAGVYSLRLAPIASPALLFGAQVLLGIAMYGALCKILRLAPFMELLAILERQWAAMRKTAPTLS